jgi:multicomponent Na+:H+ antiporter subunit D
VSAVGAMQLAVALPAAASLPIAITGRSPNLREAITLATAVVVLLLVASAVPGVLAGDRPEITLIQFVPGLSLEFRLEPLGMIFALVASFLWLVTSI